MSNIEKIRSEIERLKSKYRHNGLWLSSTQSMLAGAKIEAMNELLLSLDSLQQEQQEEPDKSLEEAAKEYAEGPECTWVGTTALEEAFIAGAKWQKEQDLAEMAQSRSPLSVAYANRCFENGKKAMEEQMLRIAKNRYEQAMTFVTGNSEVDQAIQMDRLALVKIIEEGKK